ncbi:MAG: NTP transferase domain-containing protein [Spirochaetales bacterium]|nr:NTP transferase domain-containing protein [Spirochaetales bacterium]
MKTGVLLQARIGSTRLPGKALLPLAGCTVLEHVLAAAKQIKTDIHVLVTDHRSMELFRPYTLAAGFELFEGPADDVLARYCIAAEFYQVDRVVRATGDNPLVSAKLANKNLVMHASHRADLSRFKGAPLGTGVEVVETWALQESAMRSADPYEHEHITTYMLRRQDEYRVVELDVAEQYLFPEGSVTLDTEADYRHLSAIFSDLYRGNPISIEELIVWLRKNRPAIPGREG